MGANTRVALASAACLLVLGLLLAGSAGADQPLVTVTASFSSSDQLLNRIYTDSVNTAVDVVSPPVNLYAVGCDVPNELLILDGVVRDRCAYIGDIAVSGQTLLLAGADPNLVKDMIVLFASDQMASGAIPPSACLCSGPLIDYSAYWIDTLYNYVLDTGDLTTLNGVWSNLIAVLDEWYPSVTQNGLVVNPYGNADYLGANRSGPIVAYYNAEYVWALQLATKLAQWRNDPTDASVWTARAQIIAANTLSTFWDPSAGAFKDTPDGPVVHAQDDNSFAVLAGIGSQSQDLSALNYLDTNEYYPYGNSIADNDDWDSSLFGDHSDLRVYPFISYVELQADFKLGLDSAAFSLLRREWGYMVENGPGTMWEDIGPDGGPPIGGGGSGNGSWAHGWSTGAAPVLSEYVLGVQPTSPGFATFTVIPHPDDLTSASGTVPTPHGLIAVSWKTSRAGLVLSVKAPAGTTWTNAPPSVRATPPAKGKTVKHKSSGGKR